jgi:pimeloyl-ACP methyl ester carboxylesterase
MRTLMQEVGVPTIPPEHVERIAVPTTLIWGRDDRAVRLGIAEDASARYGWPLRVIDDAGDDPKLEQPEAFLESLYTVIGRPGD